MDSKSGYAAEKRATPRLSVNVIDRDSKSTLSTPIRARNFSAALKAASEEAPGSSTANSSPPIRAGTSVARNRDLSSLPRNRRTSSPPAWPVVVVDRLEMIYIDHNQGKVRLHRTTVFEFVAGPGQERPTVE